MQATQHRHMLAVNSILHLHTRPQSRAPLTVVEHALKEQAVRVGFYRKHGPEASLATWRMGAKA